MTRLVLACLVLAACSTEEIEPGVCGNGIVDPFEDCDILASADCVDCSISCDDDNNLHCSRLAGTDGFVCGPDGFCHAPSGTFEHVNQIAMPAAGFAISDVDIDGPAELVVQSQTAISAVFAAAEEGFSSQVSIQTPIARGPASFAEIDGDGTLDVLLPTSDGIVAYTNQFGVPSPYPFPSPIGEALGQPLFVRPVIEGKLGIIGQRPNQTTLEYVVMDVLQQPPAIIRQAPLCGATLDTDSVDSVDVFDVKPRHQIAAVRIISFDGTPRICVVTIDGDNNFAVAATTFTTSGIVDSRAVLADLSGLVCPSMVVRQGGGIFEYEPVSSVTPCALKPLAVAVASVPPGADPVAAIPLVPPIANRRASAIALTTGIYAITTAGNAFEEIYRSDRPISTVSTIDIDGDGDLDALASSPNADGIDVLDRRDTQTDSGFLRFRFDTEGPVKTFLVGDYDGDEHADIAYVEAIESNTSASSMSEAPDAPVFGGVVERLSIAYGTSDQLLPGAVVGTFASVQSLIPTQIVDSTDQIGVISDLAIVFNDSISFLPVLSLLHGNPQRSMLAFFDPRRAPIAAESQFRSVVAGRFGNGDNDVLAVEQLGAQIRIYLSRGAMGGELEAQISSNTMDLVDCASSGNADANLFCVDQARYLAWPDGNHDVVIAVDEKLGMISFDPLDLVDNASFTVKPWADALVFSERLDRADLEVNTLKLITTDDGAPRMVVGLAARPDVFDSDPAAVGALDLCEFDPATGPHCVDLSAAITDRLPGLLGVGQGAELTTEAVCVDAAVARVSPARRFSPPDSETDDLLVLCRLVDFLPTSPGEPPFAIFTREDVFRVSFDLTRIELLNVSTPAFASTQIQVGDVSGDGIDDLVLLERAFSSPIFWVVRQCTSREVCAGGSLGPEMGDK